MTLSGIVQFVRPLREKAEPLIFVTLLGIVTDFRLELWKALSMRVTGRPSMASGITNAVSGPVYPVIVIEPSFVV